MTMWYPTPEKIHLEEQTKQFIIPLFFHGLGEQEEGRACHKSLYHKSKKPNSYFVISLIFLKTNRTEIE